MQSFRADDRAERTLRVIQGLTILWSVKDIQRGCQNPGQMGGFFHNAKCALSESLAAFVSEEMEG